ncbi:MAG: flagellin [Pseudomonadota bacterium]
MAQSINTNVASLNAQRNLNRSQSLLTTSLQRLSTGLRINSAKDDAAGLAISERFTTQIRGLNQAVRNASDGISLAQTAESALGELTNNLQRIRELGVQSANATNSASDRAALDEEVQQRLAEVERIASQTSFNGLKVLDGTFGNAAFQVGANVGEKINVSLTTGVRTSQIGQIASATGANAVSAAAIGPGQVSIAVGNGAAVEIASSDSDSAQDKVAAINASGVTGLTATATTEAVSAFTTIDEGAADNSDETYSLTINGEAIFTNENLSVGTGGGPITGSDLVDRVNLFANDTGVTASFDGTDVTFTAVDGRNIDISQTLAGTAPAGGLTTAAVAGNLAGGGATNRGSITLSASDNITISGGNEALLGFTATQIAKDTTGLDTLTVGTVSSAEDAIQRVDAALTTINSLRSEFGAIQNRFESTISNLQTVSENLAASRGRILDADFAAETAQLTKAQILQQAGVSVLTQANAQPQLALSLLQ